MKGEVLLHYLQSFDKQKIDPSKLDPADRAYYAEVSSRISEKLIAGLE